MMDSIAERLEVEMRWPEVHQRTTTGLFEDEGTLIEHCQSTAEELVERELNSAGH